MEQLVTTRYVVRRQVFEHPPRSHLYTGNLSLTHGTDGDAPDANPYEPPVTDDSNNGEAAPVTAAPLSTLLLTALMYTLTTSGAYGVEESVMGGGPLLTILSVLVIPLLMGAPTALVVAEMATSVPSNAGFLMWMNIAFPRTLYTTMAILALVYIAVDNALYPVMFSEYFCTAVGGCSSLGTAALRLGMLVLTFALNVCGVEAVGNVSLVLSLLTILPFALMFVIHLFRNGFYLNWAAIGYVPASVNWAQFITTASWNLSGLEQAGTVAEDIPNPQRTIMRALVPLLGLSLVTYIPPILTGASAIPGAEIDLSEWETGFWAVVGQRVGGGWLKVVTVIGGVVSAFGLTLSAMHTTSSLIAGLALTDVFPGKVGEVLSTRGRRLGTYHWALLANTVCTALFSTLLSFGSLVKVDQFLYGIRVVAIFAAFLRCRELYPYLARPFCVPLSGGELYAAMSLPIVAFVGLTLVSALEDAETILLSVGVVAVTAVMAWAYCRWLHPEPFAGRVVTVDETIEEQ